MQLLSWLIAIPIFTSVVILLSNLLLKQNKEKVSQIIFYLASFVEIALTLTMWYQFDSSTAEFQFIEKAVWFDKWPIYYSLGIDSLSIYFILLTVFLIPICVMVGMQSIKSQKNLFIILFLLLQSFVIGIFSAKDLILFYVFFEASLIPMYLIIGIWGSTNKVYAAIKFFLYTLFGSILMLLTIAYIFVNSPTLDIVELSLFTAKFTFDIQQLLWLAFFISFAIKVPLWPFHTWLPDAHVEAPTSGSVILAGILLKIGGYGLIRFNLPLFPEVSKAFADYVIWLGIIAVIYTSIVALMQTNMKKLIAYSSVAHMGYVVAGIFALNQSGLQGAIFQMISHGVISSALFLCVGILYEQGHTKEIAVYKGLAKKMPTFSLLFTIFVLASIGLPTTSGFIGEFLIILSNFRVKNIYGILLTSGMVLGAAYMLWLYIRIIFGDSKTSLEIMRDIKIKDKLILTSLALLIIILGIKPSFITQNTLTSVEQLLTEVHNNNIINSP